MAIFYLFQDDMTQAIQLKAEERKNIEGKLEKIDPNLFVPINVYGQNFKNKHAQVKAQDLKKAYETAGESNLLDLQIGSEEPLKVMFRDVQVDPVKGIIIHVDFYKVDMTKTITTEIPLEFIGESNAVKTLGGVLNKSFNEIEVECLPGDLIDHIKVDISCLETFDDAIKMQDLNLPKGMALVSNTNDVVVSVVETRVEEEPTVAPVAEEGAEKKEGEEKGEENKEEPKK